MEFITIDIYKGALKLNYCGRQILINGLEFKVLCGVLLRNNKFIKI
jgi:hypothetical protein